LGGFQAYKHGKMAFFEFTSVTFGTFVTLGKVVFESCTPRL